MVRLQSVALVIVAMLFSAPMAKPEAPSADADKLVIEALQSEIKGNASSRQALLNQALNRDPEHAPARWHTGQVLHDGKWVRFELLPQLSASTETAAEYRQIRDASAKKSYRGQLELANWCRRNDLLEQERAHLTAAAVISGSLNNQNIRARLGFVLANGRWQLRSEIQAAKSTARTEQRAFKFWTPRLARIARGLNRPSQRERCVAELRAIDDPDALPAMEAVFSNRDLSAVLVLLDAYDNMNTHLAAVALARQAMYSPWKTVRESAAKKLKSRPPEAYAPAMLASLHTPISSRLILYVGNAGVRITQAFSREHQDFKQLTVLDSQTRFANQVFAVGREQAPNRDAFNRNSKRRAVENAVIDGKLKAYAANRLVKFENDATKKLNERITTALSTATTVQLPDEPQAWWQWWLDYNELYSDGEKPCRYVCLHEETAEFVPMMAMPTSCLSAGTPIWTVLGPIAVQTVQVGDLVLAKHPETGELAYKPVLHTTVRPARQLLKVRAGETVFHATGGHTFWISGHGWLKIRDVKPGMRFHGATGPVVLDSLEEGDEAPTYNLVVADFHTYFVGQSMLLSHDPTFAQPTDLLVPGLHER